ncbi:X8 domain [Dillenia turbinata]|uniref:X8 domain n=1 Tax=Dillenia turbinata TaxID=194707 RepID=A0AAN8UP15_9MAGN
MRTHILFGMLVALLIVLTITIESNAQRKEWCVARPGATDAQLREVMEFVCRNGTVCSNFEPGQPCYLPNTLRHHASCAFNTFYQHYKRMGTTCDFNNAAIITLRDPSRSWFLPFYSSDAREDEADADGDESDDLSAKFIRHRPSSIVSPSSTSIFIEPSVASLSQLPPLFDLCVTEQCVASLNLFVASTQFPHSVASLCL